LEDSSVFSPLSDTVGLDSTDTASVLAGCGSAGWASAFLSGVVGTGVVDCMDVNQTGFVGETVCDVFRFAAAKEEVSAAR